MTEPTTDENVHGVQPLEWCRECRDEREWLAPGVPAEFILWGKLFPPEAMGPRCYDHAEKWIGASNMYRVDQWAVFDLRPLAAALARLAAVEALADDYRANCDPKSMQAMVAVMFRRAAEDVPEDEQRQNGEQR